MKLLDDLNLFRLVVENGSYTAASRKSTVPVATMTRRIQALEDSLNIRLLNRHARKLSLTEPTDKIVLYMLLINTPISFIPASFFWEWPSKDLIDCMS